MTLLPLRASMVACALLVLPATLAACGSSNKDNSNRDTVAAGGGSDTTAAIPDPNPVAAPTSATGTGAAAATSCPAADGSAAKKQVFTAAPPMCIDVAKNYTATMVTNKGTMTFTLLPAKAPKTVNNFVVLSRYHYYDGIIFHRVVPEFVLQGGDPEGTGSGGPGYTFADELPQAREYKIGSVAMANSGPDTNGSQFFVISGINGTALPPLYSLFAELADGQATVDAIAALAVNDGAPSEPVTITSVTITETPKG